MSKPSNASWKDWIEGMSLRAILSLSRILPFDLRIKVMSAITRGIIGVVPSLRRRIENNLTLIYPDMSLAEKRRIRRAVASGLGRHVVETFTTEDFVNRIENTPITGPGFEVFKAAQAEGRGVIILSGHFGNWEVARHRLGPMGYPIAGIYRPQNNPYFEADFRGSLDSANAPMFAKGGRGMRDMLRYLKGGGITAILMDQRDERGDVLDFMGKPAATPTAIAEMARRNDLPMIPVYATRLPDGVSFEIEMEAPIETGTAREMTQAFNNSLAARVHAHPEQWHWLHRRWKM